MLRVIEGNITNLDVDVIMNTAKQGLSASNATHTSIQSVHLGTTSPENRRSTLDELLH